MKGIIIFISLLSIINAHAQAEFVKQSFLDGKVEILLPSTYVSLSNSAIQEEFPNVSSAPTVICREDESSASFKIIIENNSVSKSEVGQYKGWRISKMLKDTSLKVISHDLRDINQSRVGIIKVIYPSLQRYHHYFFSSLNGRLILLILECSISDISNKDLEFDKIMNSLVIQ